MLTLATWNINSVRLRLGLVLDFLKSEQPDILCLQEIKCENGSFPTEQFEKAGYSHTAVHGQKAYHGVAILSRRPLGDIESYDYCDKGDARHVSALVETKAGSVRLHNFYVPAGGDIPDTKQNEKFRHKLDFLDEMRGVRSRRHRRPQILVGDLNIAPLPEDVWSHKQLLKVVSHTPVETEGLTSVQESGGWVDVVRHFAPPPKKLFTWWSYRARDWSVSDRGRRLDHIWTTSDLAERVRGTDILREARGWKKPSDHVPVIARLDI